jgi:L-asparaginase
MMEIVLIQTGGTIDKTYPKKPGAYAFEISEAAAGQIITAAGSRVKVIPFRQKDSQEITEADRAELKKLVYAEDSNKIIISHGTDTLIDTARYLEDIPGKTIVCFGAYQPSCVVQSDAGFQVGFAFAAVQLLGAGTYVAMNGNIIPAKFAVRNSETHLFEHRSV